MAAHRRHGVAGNGSGQNGNRLLRFFREQREKIREVNRKYSKPRLKMTPMVKFALLALRIYLITLVIILFYKLYTLVVKAP